MLIKNKIRAPSFISIFIKLKWKQNQVALFFLFSKISIFVCFLRSKKHHLYFII